MKYNNFKLIVNDGVLEVNDDTINQLALTSINGRDETNLFNTSISNFSTDFTIPNTAHNRLILGLNNDIDRVLYRTTYSFTLEIANKVITTDGSFEIISISIDTITCYIIGESSNWIKKLQKINIKELGYKDGKPTWFEPYYGTPTMNYANNRSGLYVFPTILYNNTPKTDYADFTKEDVYGLYDSSGNQIKAPLTFPDSFKCEPAFFGGRLGLTYYDFPPAINYRMLIDKCFEVVGMNASCLLFDEDWFNKIYIPYVGNKDFKYNWKTLAKLELLLRERTTSGFVNADNSIGRFINGTNYTTFMQNIMLDDNINYRTDYIYNYKKFLVSDESVESKYRIGQYIVPTNGNYNIRYKGDYSFVGTGSNLNNFGNRWQDVLLVFVRVDENGAPVYDETMEDLHNRIAHWFANEKAFVAVKPNDLIAYVSLNDLTSTGEQSDIYKAGSPLTNNEKKVNINNYSHTIITDTNTQKESYFEIDMNIDNVTLYKNERVIAFYVGLSGYGATNFNSGSMQVTINSTLSNLYIDYNCGYEDINVSENIPLNGTAYDFISSFIRMFHLDYNVQGNSIELIPSNFNSLVSNLNDITKYVQVSTIKRSKLKIPKELNVGYTIDENDRLLNLYGFDCDSTETTSLTNYGNVKKFIYNVNDDTDNVDSFVPFSSTLFYKPNVQLIDCVNAIRSFSYLDTTVFPPQLIKNVEYGSSSLYNGQYMSVSNGYTIPSIQSKTQYEVKQLSNLTYNFDYTPRLIYHLGTLSQYYGIDNKLRIPIDAPESDLIGGMPPYYTNHFIELTVSAFDKENNNPYPSLRFDTNLYETYFKDINKLYDENSEFLPIIECNMHITNELFDMVSSGNLVFTLMNRAVMILNIDGFKLTQQENYNIPVKLLLI